VQARTPKVTKFNNGNVPFELHIKSNTIVSNLGRYEPTNTTNIKPEYVELKDILNSSRRISTFYTVSYMHNINNINNPNYVYYYVYYVI